MSEKIYDEEIAPKLLEIAQLCKKHKMPFLATVWFDGEDKGTTRIVPEAIGVDQTPSYTLSHAAAFCNGNIDKLCMGLAKIVSEENDGSIALRFFRGGGSFF